MRGEITGLGHCLCTIESTPRRFLGPFDAVRNSVSADPGSGPFWPSTFEDAMVWDRTCLENGPIFASAASQSTLNQRDSGQKCFTLQVSEVGSFGGRRRGISIQFTDRPARNRGVSAP